MTRRICSVNVKGLRVQDKISHVRNTIGPCEVLCLQETHSDEKDCEFWLKRFMKKHGIWARNTLVTM